MPSAIVISSRTGRRQRDQGDRRAQSRCHPFRHPQRPDPRYGALENAPLPTGLAPKGWAHEKRPVEPGATPLEAALPPAGSLPVQRAVRIATTPSTRNPATVLGGVKDALAALGGCAALDAACARCRLAFIDGVAGPSRRGQERSERRRPVAARRRAWKTMNSSTRERNRPSS